MTDADNITDDPLTDGFRLIDACSIWIGQMPDSITSKYQVGDCFSRQVGPVSHVTLMPDLSYGFVHFYEEVHAQTAIELGHVTMRGSPVEVRRAEQKSNKAPPAFQEAPDVPEDAIKWKGRFEFYPAGHGFLRWLHWDPNTVVGIDGPDRRGAYVAPSQVVRFCLTNGDLVHAVVRPPRTRETLLELHPDRDPKIIRSETSWAMLSVIHKYAAGEDAGEPPASLGNKAGGLSESVIKWKGRFEAYRRGHGFLRPLLGSNGNSTSSKVAEATSETVGPDRGVYVALTQVRRFSLRDGDVVGALIRPPRTRLQRFRDTKMESTRDENSWSLVRVLEINHATACERDRGKQMEHDDIDGASTDVDEVFEWSGVIELWNKGRHGFLRPLPDQAADACEQPVVGAKTPGADGIYVSPYIMAEFDLVSGDVVRAKVRPPCRNSAMFALLDVLSVKRAGTETCLEFEGTFKAFKGKYGFVRPLPGEPVPEAWLADGAYIPFALVERSTLRDGQKVRVLVRPPQPPVDRSATVVEVLGHYAKPCGADVWNPLGPSDDGVTAEPAPFKTDDAQGRGALPPELASMSGMRLHGAVTKVSLGSRGLKFGFLRADHPSLSEEVFFHWSSVRARMHDGRAYIPYEGQGAFFRLDACRTRDGEGEWRLQAAQVAFHEQPDEGKAGFECYRKSWHKNTSWQQEAGMSWQAHISVNREHGSARLEGPTAAQQQMREIRSDSHFNAASQPPPAPPPPPPLPPRPPQMPMEAPVGPKACAGLSASKSRGGKSVARPTCAPHISRIVDRAAGTSDSPSDLEDVPPGCPRNIAHTDENDTCFTGQSLQEDSGSATEGCRSEVSRRPDSEKRAAPESFSLRLCPGAGPSKRARH